MAQDIESHPARGAWIEIYDVWRSIRNFLKSHPARGAWIEIWNFHQLAALDFVAPRKGCVD